MSYVITALVCLVLGGIGGAFLYKYKLAGLLPTLQKDIDAAKAKLKL